MGLFDRSYKQSRQSKPKSNRKKSSWDETEVTRAYNDIGKLREALEKTQIMVNRFRLPKIPDPRSIPIRIESPLEMFTELDFIAKNLKMEIPDLVKMILMDYLEKHYLSALARKGLLKDREDREVPPPPPVKPPPPKVG